MSGGKIFNFNWFQTGKGEITQIKNEVTCHDTWMFRVSECTCLLFNTREQFFSATFEYHGI